LAASAKRSGHCEDALDEARVRRAIGAEGALTPEHSGAKGALSGVVGGLDGWMVEEKPERGFVTQQGAAHARRLHRRGELGTVP
jgi:hypothetical protein